MSSGLDVVFLGVGSEPPTAGRGTSIGTFDCCFLDVFLDVVVCGKIEVSLVERPFSTAWYIPTVKNTYAREMILYEEENGRPIYRWLLLSARPLKRFVPHAAMDRGTDLAWQAGLAGCWRGVKKLLTRVG